MADIIIKDLGLKNWEETAYSMYKFTSLRTALSLDEIWFVEHYPVFTLGQSSSTNNVYISKDIPLFFSNRGGKITYHGPGQQLIYFLIDIVRLGINIRQLISIMKKIIIETLDHFYIIGMFKKKNPGIYVKEKKICSLGLRIKHGCSLHGLALNVNMDLHPFKLINPCGCSDIKMTQIKNLNPQISYIQVKNILVKKCLKVFSDLYNCKT